MIQTLISILYNAALLLLLLVGSPWWLYLTFSDGKFREGLRERFLGVSATFAATLPNKPRIWIHAVSVGEVLAIAGLVQELATRLPDYEVVISTTTRTGRHLAGRRFGEARCFYFPFDFPWSVVATFSRIAPAIFILAESEFWPNVLSACSRKQIPVVVVNARVSDRSLPRYLRLRPLWKPFLRMLSMVFAQTVRDADRLRSIGVPAECVQVGGNLKFDIRPPQDVVITQLVQQQLALNAKLLVCGSTLEGEETLLLAAWPAILRRAPDAVMLLAPRHPERFDTVAALLAASPHVWTRRSAWMNTPQPIAAGSIFLLDSIGELAVLFAVASVAFIGGSLIPAGGHNPLEAAQFAVPIVMGPHTENFRSIVQMLVDSDGIAIAQPDRIADVVSELLVDDNRAMTLGKNAQRVCEREAGATERCTDAIVKMLGVRA